MSLPRRAGPVLLLALLLAAGGAARVHAGAFASTTTTLRNHLRVVLAPDPDALGVDAAIWFPAGLRDEKGPAQAGLSVLAGRLAFRNGAADPLATLAAAGGTGSIAVTPDYTTFSATVPPEAIGTAIAFLAERTPGAPVQAADLASERALLRAEQARPERTPVAVALSRLWAAAWPGHPYAKTGTIPAAATTVTPAAIESWRRARFVPAGAVLTVAGAFDADKTLAAIRDRFESIPAGAAPGHVAVAPPRTGERSTGRIDSQARLCLVGWRGPGAGDPDVPALEVLASWIGGSPQSKLAKAMVDDFHLAVAAQAGFTPQRDGSLLWTLAVVQPGADSAAVENSLVDLAMSAARSAPPTFELERARRQLEALSLFGSQTARQRSQALGDAELLSSGAAAADRRLDALRAVKAADLQRVAARVMTDAARATVWMLPAAEGPR